MRWTDRHVFIIDDEIHTGGTIMAAAEIAHAARRPERHGRLRTPHPLRAAPSTRICGNATIEELVVTDTIPLPVEKQNDKITVLSVAPLMGEAITRIHTGRSVGQLFA